MTNQMTRGTQIDRWLLAFCVAGGAVLTWLALVEAPSFAGRSGFTAPLSWKLFFFHVPIAFASFVAFGFAFYNSLTFLLRPRSQTDARAQAAVEVGVLFAALTLATGMVWGKAEWGEPWRWWDTKLVLVLLMFLIYVAYLLLRRELADDEKRARLLAVYAVAAFATVPLAWFAQRIWLSAHPVVFGNETPESGLATPGVLPIFLLGLLVFLAIFAYFYRRRLRLFEWAWRVREVRERLEVGA